MTPNDALLVLIAELRIQIEQKDQEIIALRSLVTQHQQKEATVGDHHD